MQKINRKVPNLTVHNNKIKIPVALQHLQKCAYSSVMQLQKSPLQKQFYLVYFSLLLQQQTN